MYDKSRWGASFMGAGMSFVWFLSSFAFVEIEFEISLFNGFLLEVAILYGITAFIVNLVVISKLEIPENQFYHDLFWIIYFAPFAIVMPKIIYGWAKSIWAMMMI